MEELTRAVPVSSEFILVQSKIYCDKNRVLILKKSKTVCKLLN